MLLAICFPFFALISTVQNNATLLDLPLTARRYASAVFAVVACPSGTSRYCIKTTERMELLFGMEASSYLSHIALLGNLGISENYGTSLWMFV